MWNYNSKAWWKYPIALLCAKSAYMFCIKIKICVIISYSVLEIANAVLLTLRGEIFIRWTKITQNHLNSKELGQRQNLCNFNDNSRLHFDEILSRWGQPVIKFSSKWHFRFGAGPANVCEDCCSPSDYIVQVPYMRGKQHTYLHVTSAYMVSLIIIFRNIKMNYIPYCRIRIPGVLTAYLLHFIQSKSIGYSFANRD